MKKTLGILAVFFFMACQNNGPQATVEPDKKEPTLQSHQDSISYSLGVNFAYKIKEQGLIGVNPNVFQAGLLAALSADSTVLSIDQANELLIAYYKEFRAASMARNLKEGEQFLAENKKRSGVVTLESGLQYEILNEGRGKSPRNTQNVKCHYEGTLIDGTVFESTIESGTPTIFPVNGVIKGMEEALMLMQKGSKWRLYIPAKLAYGEKPFPGGIIQPNMALVYELELLSIENN